jgi:release factor glutamine methyltransferase
MPGWQQGAERMTSESDIPTTWGVQLALAEETLAAAGSAAPREEAVELLSHLLSVPGFELLAKRSSPMRSLDAVVYAAWVARRSSGEALVGITGHLEFMGLDIAVGHDSSLTPPSAQRLVETALQWARRRPPGELVAAEMSTGCGAISLALAALEPRFTRIYAVESSPTGLETARANGARYLLNLVISWLDGERLDAVPEPVDLIVCAQPDWVNLEAVTAKLRPSGALICAIDETLRTAANDWLVHGGYSSAPMWLEGYSDGSALVVAQLRRNSAGG